MLERKVTQNMKISVLVAGIIASVTAIPMTVTCGSVVRITHVDSKQHLHVSGAQWGGGSGQLAVTAVEAKDPHNQWVVKGADRIHCDVGSPVKCGSTIRLESMNFGANLHSHRVPSPISREMFEVSAMGDNGNGDAGDNFEVECIDGNSVWRISERIALKHKLMNGYVQTSSRSRFTQQNCPRCPIVGQLEVSLGKPKSRPASGDFFKAEDILMVSMEDFPPEDDERDEL